MFHPVGTQPPAVYWRRRLFLVGTFVLLVVLLVLTVNAIRSDGNGRASAGSPTSTGKSASSAKTNGSPSASSPRAKPSTTRRTSSSASKSSSSRQSSATTAAAPACEASDLQLRSVVEKSTYRVGDTPLLQLQVTNTGPQPCVQDLADKQVVLRVYNGESRIWGSHDCKVEPGTLDRTLTPDVAILVSIKWSGLTSAAGCTGTRQRVGPGTYTLFAALAGQQAHAAQFTIS